MDIVRRVITLGAAWLVAAVVATAVAWQGIGVVGDQVTDERPRPLSASEVEAALHPPESTPPTGALDAPTTTAPSPSPSTTVLPRATPSTTAPARAGATATTTAATPTTSTSAPAVTRTYNLVGGSTALRFSPSGVTVLWANPKPGFSVDTGSGEGRGGVEVEFRSNTHRSEVRGWWDDGPRDEVDEEEASDGESESEH